MLQAVVGNSRKMLAELHRRFLRQPPPAPAPVVRPSANGAATRYRPLTRVILTDGVGHTLFEQYAAHRREARGEEEIGWMLLGIRRADEAVVLATLPAGAQRDAGVSHVLFNERAQALGSRIVRQSDRRLTTLGVVHTHPGSLRHPSDADYRGDHPWVRQLRGGEGIFGIGTADGEPGAASQFASQPRPHVQALGELSLSWYSLRHGEARYRPLPVGLTLGPDVARPLHDVWEVVERHAEQLERIYRQQAGVTFQLVGAEGARALAVKIGLAEPGQSICVLLEGEAVRYYLLRDNETLAVDYPDEPVDRAVYLMLAALAKQE